VLALLAILFEAILQAAFGSGGVLDPPMQRRSRPEVETALQCRSTRLESRMEKEIWRPTGRTIVPPPAPSPVLWLC
jgi:hypothetical protein